MDGVELTVTSQSFSAVGTRWDISNILIYLDFFSVTSSCVPLCGTIRYTGLVCNDCAVPFCE